MKNKCLRAVSQYNMLSPGDHVVVAVSGGADSMALLHFLHKHAADFGITVTAAHFNHCIRGKEADDDERFVREFCNLNHIPFQSKRADVPSIAQSMQTGIEECARTLRYAFLQETAAGGKIATAHTGSDACETFLFNFARGTGLQGLCGIPAVRGNIIRPFIFCAAQDTRDYCVQNSVLWREDSTNQSVDYSRNQIRLKTIPTLKNVNAAFEENALRCLSILQNENDFMLQCAMNAYENCKNGEHSISLSSLKNEHPALVSRIVLHFARQCGCRDVSMKQVDSLLQMNEGDVVTLLAGIQFKRQKDSIALYEKFIPTAIEPISVGVEDNFVSFGNSYVYFKHEVYNKETINRYSCFVDAAKCEHLALRSRMPGDSIRLRERKCTKTLKQLFNEKKIPLKERSAVPVLVDKDGVIWVGGIGVNENRLPDENTENILIIEWSR